MPQKLKIVYVAHPISGDLRDNLKDIQRIIVLLNKKYKNTVFSVPYFGDVMSLDDSYANDRRRGMRNCMALIDTGAFDELWLTGDHISKGMQAEMMRFAVKGLPIINHIGKF